MTDGSNGFHFDENIDKKKKYIIINFSMDNI